MGFLMNVFYIIKTNINIEQIVFLLHATPFAYIITIALFCCVLLIMNVFSTYKILNIRILIAWIFACMTTFVYIVNGHDDMKSIQFNTALHSQAILSFASTTVLFIFYLFGLISSKPHKKRKNFGYHTWWINAVYFVVLFAFCCMFNIGLFVSAALFYL